SAGTRAPPRTRRSPRAGFFVFMGTFASDFFFSAFSVSTFTMHHHLSFCGCGFPIYCNRCAGPFSLGSGFAHFQLHEVGWVNTRITGRAKPTVGVRDGLFERRKREVAKRIRAEEFADFLGRLRG